MKNLPQLRLLSGALFSSFCLAAAPGALANDWVNPGVGDWSDPANWNGGVPNNSGGWAIGNVANGGTAFVTTTVPNVSEAWCGNGASGGPSNGAGNLTVSAGGVLSVDNWLVVGRMCCPSPIPCPLSIFTVDGGTVNKKGDGFLIGDTVGGLTGIGGTGQMDLKGNAVVNVTGGWFSVCPGGYSVGTVNMQDNAQFNASGLDFNIGDWGNGRAVFNIQDNASLKVTSLWVGKWDNIVAVLNQSGGSFIGTGGGNEWCFGGNGSGSPVAYAFFNKSGGLLDTPNNVWAGGFGRGLFYQSGGTNRFGGWTAVGRQGASYGVAWVTGGTWMHTGAGGTHCIVGEQGRGEFTLSGSGIVDCATTWVIGHGYNGIDGTGICNLNGGTAVIQGFEKFGNGFGYVNFNGTTIKPKNSNPNFTSALTEARIYPGNAIFDTAGYDINVSQNLLDGAGQGVTSISVASAGAGYMGPPIVQITGDGFGATAVAQVDVASGTVTNVIVTCPGTGYSTASATLLGGGATTEATLGSPAIGTIGSGGVIKNGDGTLTLSGANSYVGATVVNQGTLVTTPYSIGMGSVSIANGAGLGVLMPFGFSQVFQSSITFGTSGGTTLAFDLGAFGNPVSAPLSVVGNIAVNGTVTVNVADALPQLGQVPLLQYGSRSGSGSFVLGSLPNGVQGNLVDDTVNKLVYINITGVGLPRWDGQAGGDWDINVTTNWIELSTGLPSYYKDGAPVLFDDNALGTNTVNLVTTVKPASVTITNSTQNYSLIGAGKISGATGLLKQGNGSFSIANSTANDYTGPTTISGGTLAVTNLANGGVPSAIGKSSSAAANLVLAGGTLSYAGPAVTIDRAYSAQGSGSTIDAQSDLTLSGNPTATIGGSLRKAGAAKLTYTGTGINELSGGGFPGVNVVNGTMVFDGSAGSQVNHSQNEFWVGGTVDTPASLVLTNTTLNIDSWFAIGRGNGFSGYSSRATLYNSALRSGSFSMGYDNGVAGNLQSPVLSFFGNSSMTNNGDSNIGESPGSLATINLNDTSTLYSGWRLFVGWHTNTASGEAGTGRVVIANSSKMYVNAWLSIGNEGGIGSLVAKDNSSLWVLWDLNVTDVGLGEGTLNIQDNATVTANNYFVGKGVGSFGVVNQTGGSANGILNDGNEYHIGFRGQGTWNLSAGNIIAPNHWFIVGRWAEGPGIFNVTGGYVNHGTNNTGKLFRVGEDGTGVLNLSGTGVIETHCNEVTIGWNATGNGTVNLDGGVFQARRIIGGTSGGSSTFNFNGGLLRAGPNANANFMTALGGVYVNAGGAKIDTGNNTIAINQDLLAGAGSGGLTKSGDGNLALNGVCSYVGPTLVTLGGLGGNGTISSPVTIQATGGFSPGLVGAEAVGALTINNTLNLDGITLMHIDAATGTNDQVLGVTTLTYGGTLVLTNMAGTPAVGTVYKLFTAGTYAGGFTSVVSANPGITYDSSKLLVDGTVKVLTAVNTTPIAIETTTGPGGLTVKWPADHIGWTLQIQTNAITTGLSNNWVPVPASQTVNEITIPIDPANGTVFLRLVYP